MTDYTTASAEILKAPKKAKEELFAAVEALNEFKSQKDDAINAKLADYKNQLQKIESAIDAKTSELAEELAAGNDQAAAKLEKEIGQLTAKAEPLRKIVEKIESGKTKYMQTEEGDALMRAMLQAWDRTVETVREASEGLNELCRKGEEELDALKEAIHRIKSRCVSAPELKNIEGYTANTNEGRHIAQIVGFYEERYGKIDVAGHTAGDDLEAKVRYIRNGGNCRGLELTAVAGTTPPHLAAGNIE